MEHTFNYNEYSDITINRIAHIEDDEGNKPLRLILLLLVGSEKQV